MKKIVSVIAIILCLTATSIAQEYHRPFQFTFFYPVGTNGGESTEYSSNFSFNLLFGMNHSVDGFELGGIFNYNKGGVRGAQIAGVMNFNNQASNGALIAGALNYQKDDFIGLQLAAVNFNEGNYNGAQIGVVNYSRDFIGAQLGTITIARDFRGAQIGTVSIAHDLVGAQLGTVNIARELNGAQIGTVNVAKSVKGTQIGIVNIMGKNTGAIPVGIINVVKNGYYALELSSNEVMYSNLSFKMGVRKFYSIIKIGASLYDGEFINSYGFGFGGLFDIGRKTMLAVEGTSSQIVYEDNWGDDLSLLNRLDVNFQFELAKGFHLAVGPSFNVYVTDAPGNGELGNLNIPYTFHDEIDGDYRVASWIGANIGLVFEL